MEVTYPDGIIQSIPVRFTDWWSSYPVYEEEVIWKGKCAKFKDNEFTVVPNTVSIFAVCFRLKDKKEILKLKLPECHNIHIFAIALGK